jgi:hypothetical protein
MVPRLDKKLVLRLLGMTMLKNAISVADILERELQPTIKEWLRQVKLVPELTDTPLSDADRARHLPRLFKDLICRLRLGNAGQPMVSEAAVAHGEIRYAQGYSAAMLVDESRLLEVATFSTLQLHQSELDQTELLSDIIVIADEADAQLTETVRSLTRLNLVKASGPS